MLNPASLRQKSRIVPGQVPVIFTPKNPVGSELQIFGARRRDITDLGTLVAAGLNVTFNSKLWILPADEMGGVLPKKDDIINDGTTDWIVEGSVAAMEAGGAAVEHKLACNRAR